MQHVAIMSCSQQEEKFRAAESPLSIFSPLLVVLLLLFLVTFPPSSFTPPASSWDGHLTPTNAHSSLRSPPTQIF